MLWNTTSSVHFYTSSGEVECLAHFCFARRCRGVVFGDRAHCAAT